MRPSRKLTIAGLALVVVFLTLTVTALNRVDSLRTGASLEEVLYVPSPKVVKRLTLGYDGLAADIYWTRAVQYFGSKHHTGATQYMLLAPLLEITTYLDPHLVVAYEFGANFLSPPPPNGAGLPERAVKLVQHGIANNPGEWKLYYQLGFIYYLELHDYTLAAEAFQKGSEQPGAHPFLKILAANMAQHAGELETARMLWITTYESTHDEQIKLNAVAHLRALKVDEDVTNLQKLVEPYREKTGHFPSSLGDFVVSGMLPGIPVDPSGRPYKITGDGRIEVRQPDDFPFVTRGLPPGYEPGVPNLSKVNPEIPQ